MKITYNGAGLQIPEGTTLRQLLEINKITPQGIATAVNDEVVPKTQRDTLELREGDNVLIISAFYGG